MTPARMCGGGAPSPLLLLLMLAALPAPAAAETRATPLHARAGDLPILLCAPHDGPLALRGLPRRENRDGRQDFRHLRDLHTRALLFAVAAEIRRLTGREPYLVVNYLDRGFMDPNREPHRGAYEHALGEAAWHAYHGAIAGFRREIVRRFGAGALVDLHGHVSEPADLYLGTRGGLTVGAASQPKARARLLRGPASLPARLARAGYALPDFARVVRTDQPGKTRLPRPVVVPLPAGNPAHLDGGATVTLHGAHRPHGLAAWQVEVHRRIRFDPRARARFARALAAALVAGLEPGSR